MKSHVVLLGRVLEDLSIRCCTSTTNDLKTVISRVENEGVSFLTITLPTFASDFERSLELGKVDSTLFVSFQKRASLPAFLQGLTSLVFDKKTGVLLDDPSIDAIQGIRQVCNLFKKLEVPCSPERNKAAIEQYVKTESDVRMGMMTMDRDLLRDYRRIAHLLFWDLFYQCDLAIANGELVPKHGPGATADRVRGNAKFQNRIWTERLEKLFLASEYLFTTPYQYFTDMESVVWLTPEQEIPSRIVSVPKTLKAPRIIAIEPVYMQYVQQAIHEFLADGTEKDNYLSHFIGFTDQEPNRTMACQGSRTSEFATLDLSEASDRVSIQHVVNLLHEHPLTKEAVFACRSTKADVPGHGVLTLAKYASMGSALTFPLEAMVFLTVVFLGIEKELKTPLSKKLIKSFFGKVRIYGDDIIVPVDFVPSVIESLEAFGLKVNSSKSFWTGKFRESCGGDYFNGWNVGYVKARRVLPSSRKHVSEIVSTVALRNQMYTSGYWRTAEYLDRILERVIPMPRIGPDSPGLGRYSYLGYDVQKECPNLQRPLVRAAVVDSVIPESNLEDDGALLKYFLKRGDEPFADKRHLERAGRPVAVNIKLRWTPSY